ncbi:MAG: DNA-binding protein [Candidatus Cloacimonadota bacterium]|nr:MAG: DNA-binding protein [Candidatus Cloacimonadota bacterium]
MSQIIDTLIPNDIDIKNEEECSRVLLSNMKENHSIELQLKNNPLQSLTLSSPILQMLLKVLDQTVKGNALTIYPTEVKLTSQEAANILNVSRPFLIKLLETEKIPFYRVGTHRRILLKDLLKYKTRMLVKREDALDELTALSQELDMGY